MKKIIFFIVCCLMATTQYIHANEGTGKVFLQHAGTITKTFASDELQKAIDTAEEGDTLFLSKGKFTTSNNGFNINKSICLIGSGVNKYPNQYRADDCTELSNHLFIRSTNSDNVIPSIIIEGIALGVNSGGNTAIYSDINNLVIKQCTMFSFHLSNSDSGNLTFDRCSIAYLYLDNYVQNFTAKNCKINTFDCKYATTTASNKIINCNIFNVKKNVQKCMFINSIINQVGNGTSDSLEENVTLVNTLYHSLNGFDPMEKTTQQDCWSTTDITIEGATGSLDSKCTMTKEQLKTAGYLGVDGTVVGVEGGANPYSLTLHSPSINSNSATIDLNNKKVTINVNVTAN